MALPQVGEVHDGYRYDGGDPNAKGSWSWVGDGTASVEPKVPKLSPTDQKELGDLRDKSRTSLNAATQAERFVGINKRQGTGGISGAPLLPIPSFMGSSPLIGDVIAAIRGNPKWSEMKSITAAVAPGLRPPGSGSSSDKDTKTYRESFPNVENLGPANVQIQKRWQAQSNEDAARAAFMDRWSQIHGSLLGGEAAFQRYWADQGERKFGLDAMMKKPAKPAFKYLGPEGE